MKKEVIGDCTLYLGDCRDVMAEMGDKSVDAVVTDPPYGISGGVGGDARQFGKGVYEGGLWEDTPEYIKEAVVPAIEESIEKMRIGGAVTPGSRNLHLYPPSLGIGCFWTPASCTHTPWGFSTFQPILYYGVDWRRGKGALPNGKRVVEASEKTGHPCAKPIKAWEWLVDKVSPEGSLVFDPFMGSGTTGVACVELGRKFIGVEIEPKYFDIACKRIDMAARQGKLF